MVSAASNLEVSFNDLIACPGCDLLHQRRVLHVGESARCDRCDDVIQTCKPHTVERALAVSIAALLFLLVSLFTPFLSLSRAGIESHISMLDAVRSLWDSHMRWLGISTVAFIVMLPLTRLVFMVWVLCSLHFKIKARRFMRAAFRWALILEPWAMADIFMVGVVVQRTWAFLLVGIIAYIPANTTPIMSTTSFMGNTSDTIMSGVFSLIATGSYFVAFVVFFASICIPVFKFIAIALLALGLQFSWNISEHNRHRLHTLTEFIGRWSMLDVFVVAVLAALIQLGAIITVAPGIGINAFAVSVVFTMLAASSLDSRLLWDVQTPNTPKDVTGDRLMEQTVSR